MPTYQYYCKRCNKSFTKLMTLSQHEQWPKPVCPKCRSRKIEQLPSSFQAVTSKKS